MKVYIGQRDLKMLLEQATLFVPRKASLPVLEHVLIRGTRGKKGFHRLIVAATSIDQAIATWLLTDVVEEGEALVEAKPLLEFVKSLPNEDVTLETHTIQDATVLTVRCGDIESTFPVLADDFPVPERIEGPRIRVYGDQLQLALRQVVPAASKDPARPTLEGVLFEVEGQSLHLIATDGYRLAHATIDAYDVPEGLEIPKYTWIVPATALAKVEKILRKQKYDGDILIQPDFPDDDKATPRTAFRWAGVSVGVMNIDATYPKWEQIVEPTRENPLRIIASEPDLSRAVKALKTAAKAGNNMIRIRVNGVVEMSASAVEVGERKMTLPAEIFGQHGDEEYAIALNWRYLEDALKALKKQRVLLAFPDNPLRPVLIQPADYLGHFEYIQMPMRTK